MKASILAIGSEILQGFLVDTNSPYLAQELATMGITVAGIQGVGDEQNAIVRAIHRAMEDADLVVCTGGIGPTSDDLSREAVAEVCGEVPTVDADVLATVESFFRRRGSVMPQRNAKQAWVIPSADVLENPMGTAPGWFVTRGNRRIVLMPGVPREMKPMWEYQVVPRLLPLLGEVAIASATLKTIGVGESAVEELLRDIIDRGFPVVSTYAKDDGVHVRIHATGQSHADARQAVDAAEAEIRQHLGRAVYGDLSTSLPVAVLQPLMNSGSTIAVWECGTAAQVATLLMSDPDVAPVIARAVCQPRASVASELDDLPLVAASTAEVQQEAGADNALGVLVSPRGADELGRVDAVIDILVRLNDHEFSTQHTFAAREMELGRRASLLAAEALRAALLDSTSARME